MKGEIMIKKKILSLSLLGVSLVNPQRQRVFRCAVLAAALSLGTSGIVTAQQCLVSTIAFTSNRDHPPFTPDLYKAEIYLMNPDGTNVRRLTDNTDGDAFPAFSPDGKRIVFGSNRDNALQVPPQVPLNIGYLFLMNDKDNFQTLLTLGDSPTWSPDAKYIAFHRSASGAACPYSGPPYPAENPTPPGCPIKTDAGAATWDSDIFIARVGDLIDNVGEPTNITNSPDAIDDDPDWSPTGQEIAFTSHPVDNDPIDSTSAEIYLKNVETGALTRLTFNNEEERGPAWSPDGTRIAYMCRKGSNGTFEICVMDANGTNPLQLTSNTVFDGAPSWSPDGKKILFVRPVPLRGQQIWTMNADGTGQALLTSDPDQFPGINTLAKWGAVRTNCEK
jgi:Tol biopolymer transport system component